MSICSREGSCVTLPVLSASFHSSQSGGRRERATSKFASNTGDFKLRSPIEITSPGLTMYDGMLTILAVDAEMTMGHELARLRAARRQIQAIDDVVETAFEQLQERAAGLTRNARGLAEVVLELRFVHAIVATHLLLLAQLTAVLGNFRALLLPAVFWPGAVPRRSTAHFLREAAVALKEQLNFFARFTRGRFATAQTADGSNVT